MVQIQNYLNKTNEFQDSRHLPLLNSLFVERFSQFNPYSEANNFKTYMTWARRSPQLMGFLRLIVSDILSDERHFNPVNRSKDDSGRNKIIKAKNFWDKNRGLEVLEESCYDLFITGIGYNWKGMVSDVQLKEFCSSFCKNYPYGIEGKELEMKSENLFSTLKMESPHNLVKKWRHVASSTMTIHTDEHDVLYYVQRVGVNTITFSPEEIMTFKLMPLDGKVFPYAPFESLLAEIYLLWMITQNYISFFENGGKPDNVFILPKEIAGSKNHEYLIETLKKYKKIENKHGNLVFTGDLSIEQLMKVEDQMENKDLSLYIVGVLAMFYNVPVSRIPFLIGKAANNGDSGGLADAGYWRMISVLQGKLEEVYNSQLWRPYFGVEFEFSRGYLQDEVRETQNDMQKTQVAEQRIRLGLWTAKKAGEYLGIDERDIEEAQKEVEHTLVKTGMLMENLNNNKNVLPEADAQRKAEQKRQTQNNNKMENGGNSK
jgi:hypothetical protein